jgi:hypothetical protein
MGVQPPPATVVLGAALGRRVFLVELARVDRELVVEQAGRGRPYGERLVVEAKVPVGDRFLALNRGMVARE